jgi:hypothetical protein
VIVAFIFGKDALHGDQGSLVAPLTITTIGLLFLAAGVFGALRTAKRGREKGQSNVTSTTAYLLATGFGLLLVAAWMAWFG